MNDYLDLARRGKNDWWRFVLAVLLMLFLWQIIGSIPTAILLVWVLLFGKAQTYTEAVTMAGVDPLLKFVALMLASVFFVIGIFLAVRFIHRRSLLTLITPARSLDWRRLWQGFGLWLVLASLTSILEAVLHPGRYIWAFDAARLIPFALLALVLIPIQASTEELFFRGYLLQGVGLRIRNIWVLCLISGLLFMAPHFLNPEAASNYFLMGLAYFLMGAFLAYITLRDGRLELALGVHTANNLFAILFANTSISALPSPSLFTVNTLDPLYSAVAGLAAWLVFVWLIFGPLRRKDNTAPISSGAVQPPE